MVTFRPPSINTLVLHFFSGAKSNLMGTRDLLLLMGATEASSSSLRALKFRWAKVVDPKVINVKHIWKIRSNSKNMLVTLAKEFTTPEFCVGFFSWLVILPANFCSAWVNRCKVVPRFIFTGTTQFDDDMYIHVALCNEKMAWFQHWNTSNKISEKNVHPCCLLVLCLESYDGAIWRKHHQVKRHSKNIF